MKKRKVQIVRADADRDWPEDCNDENGSYACLCVTCDGLFFGHKRRVECRVCNDKRLATRLRLKPEKNQATRS